MWHFKVLLFVVLASPSEVGYAFDGFMPEKNLYFSNPESLSNLLFHGVNQKCNETLRGLDTDTRWRYFDSWGKPGSGILSGNVKWFGAFDQCIEIPDAKYCLVTVLGKFHTNKTLPIWYGICVPNACDDADISIGIENFFHNVSNRFFPSIRKLALSCYKEQSYTTAVVFTIILCAVVLLFCVIGTAIEISLESFVDNGNELDYYVKQNDILNRDNKPEECSLGPKLIDVNETTPLIRPNKKQNGFIDSVKLKTPLENDTASFKEDTVDSRHKTKPNGIFVQVFLCFSLLRNTRAVLKTDVTPGTMTSLNGLRVISMFWIILCHLYVFAKPIDGIVENYQELNKQVENFSMMVIANGYPAVDTFFFLGGLLLMYTVMKSLKNNDGAIHWGKFYLHRFLRLTPAMMFVILFVVQLEPFVDKGPLWQQHLNKQTCDEYWWTNLLYINNFYPTNPATDSCLSWLWYLAVDMQFFILTPIIIYIFYRYEYRGVIGSSLFFVISSIICIAVITKNCDIHPMSASMEKASGTSAADMFNYLYTKPYCRVHPYIIGLAFGYLVHRGVFRAKQLNWLFVVVLWFIAVAAGLSIIYGPFTALREDPRPWTMTEKIFYNSTQHLVWGLLLAWVTYACEFGYGGYVHEFLSSKFWIPLGRLTYCTYLVHCELIKVMYAGYRSGLFFSTHWWAYLYCAVLLMSHGIAFILVITIEYPCANLEKLLLGKKRRKDQK
ncbi:nose resistant to fluoxetine protein 6-like [Dendronephthya gigantea]|uniref:nose resistant to fluoxetine protein 6-like n=1 Tax=Dendronephthya gigantea TaxID=151771 RepID=UPI001069FBCE|nr:nose resistant to fluoxetine protein 6-like [Dendronephthya gigantea]